MKKDRYDLALGREKVEPPMPLPPIDSRYCNPRGTIPDDVLKKAFNEARKSDMSLGVDEVFYTPTEGWGHQPLFTVHALINHVTGDVKRAARVVAPDNNADGVADILWEHVLGRGWLPGE